MSAKPANIPQEAWNRMPENVKQIYLQQAQTKLTPAPTPKYIPPTVDQLISMGLTRDQAKAIITPITVVEATEKAKQTATVASTVVPTVSKPAVSTPVATVATVTSGKPSNIPQNVWEAMTGTERQDIIAYYAKTTPSPSPPLDLLGSIQSGANKIVLGLQDVAGKILSPPSPYLKMIEKEKTAEEASIFDPYKQQLAQYESEARKSFQGQMVQEEQRARSEFEKSLSEAKTKAIQTGTSQQDLADWEKNQRSQFESSIVKLKEDYQSKIDQQEQQYRQDFEKGLQLSKTKATQQGATSEQISSWESGERTKFDSAIADWKKGLEPIIAQEEQKERQRFETLLGIEKTKAEQSTQGYLNEFAQWETAQKSLFESSIADWKKSEASTFETQVSGWKSQQQSVLQKSIMTFESSWQPKGLAERIAEIGMPSKTAQLETMLKTAPLLSLTGFDIKKTTMGIPTLGTPFQMVAGVVAAPEAFAYSIANLVGIKTPKIPPTLSSGLITSGIESIMSGKPTTSQEFEQLKQYGGGYVFGSVVGDVLLTLGISKALEPITTPIAERLAPHLPEKLQNLLFKKEPVIEVTEKTREITPEAMTLTIKDVIIGKEIPESLGESILGTEPSTLNIAEALEKMGSKVETELTLKKGWLTEESELYLGGWQETIKGRGLAAESLKSSFFKWATGGGAEDSEGLFYNVMHGTPSTPMSKTLAGTTGLSQELLQKTVQKTMEVSLKELIAPTTISKVAPALVSVTATKTKYPKTAELATTFQIPAISPMQTWLGIPYFKAAVAEETGLEFYTMPSEMAGIKSTLKQVPALSFQLTTLRTSALKSVIDVKTSVKDLLKVTPTTITSPSQIIFQEQKVSPIQISTPALTTTQIQKITPVQAQVLITIPKLIGITPQRPITPTRITEEQKEEERKRELLKRYKKKKAEYLYPVLGESEVARHIWGRNQKSRRR